MAVKVNGSRGGELSFRASFDISEVEENAKRVLSLLDNVKKQASAASQGGAVDSSFRKEQIAVQKALTDSRLALQKLKEEQQAQRNVQEKSKSVIAAERAEIEKLKAVNVELNNQYKAGKIALAEYTLEQRKIADAQRQSTLAQREAERTLREQVRLQKEQERQAARNKKVLEQESSEYYKLSTALGNVRKQAKDTQAEMFRLEREGLKTSDAYRQLEIRSKALTAQTMVLDTGVKRIDASLGLHQRNVGNYGDAISNLSPMFASINQNLGNFGTSIDDLATRPDPFKALGASLMAFGRASLAFLATPVGAALAVVAALYALIKGNKQTVVEFNSGLLGVSKTTGIANEELTGLGKSLVSLSSKLGTVPTKQLLEYAQAAGQLGVKGSANILKFSETLAMLETASDISGEEGAAGIARLLNLTDGGVENVQAFGNEIVKLGNNFAATEAEILHNAQRIAQSTALYDVSRQSVLAYATATKAVGIEAQVVGSALGRTFGAIEKSIRTGKNIETFAAVTGKSVQQLKKDFGSDASGVFNDFIKGLNGVKTAGGSVQGVLESLSITSVEDQRVIASLATNGYNVLEDAIVAAGSAGNAMQQEFETANKKLENVGKRIGIAWDNLVLSIENGQGVFATVGSYIGNQFADFLVDAKEGIDSFGVAMRVAGQYLDDYKPKLEKASEANMQYASTFAGISKFFEDISLKNFIYTMEVEIPNAFREAGANIDILKNVIVGFAKFVTTAGPELKKVLADALNPFADADTSAVNALFSSFKSGVKATNAAIIEDTKKTNQVAIDLFKQRYKDAEQATVQGEQALAAAKVKGLNGALAAATEAEIAAAEAVAAAAKFKVKQAEEAAKRAEEAAQRAAAAASGASEEAKAEADEAAKRAADAAANAREAANGAMQAYKDRSDARRAMQAKIDEINAEAHRKELSQNEAEVQAVKDKYSKIRKEVEAFYRNPKNRGLKVDTSGLPKAEQAELSNITAKQEVEALKVSIGEQKTLYQQLENYKTEYGEQKARERFQGEVSAFESYVAYLKSLVPDASDTSVLANKMRAMLEPEIDKAEKAARDKALDDNLKNLQRVKDATETANIQRLALERQYFEDLATLEKEYAGEQNADELTARKAALDEQHRQKLEANKQLAFEETEFFKKAMRDITHMTRDELKARIKELKKILKDPALSPVERAVAQKALGSAEGYYSETSKAVADAEEFQKYSQLAASSFDQMAGALKGMNPELAKSLSTMGELAGIAGNAAGAYAGFVSGNPVQAIQGAVGAITGIINLFDNTAEKQAAAEAKRQRSLEETKRAIDEMNRSLERQAEIIDKALGTDRISAFRRQMQLLTSDISETIKRLQELDVKQAGFGRTGLETRDYAINLAELNELFGKIEAGGRPDRGTGAPGRPGAPGKILETIEEVIAENNKIIDQIYKDLASGKLVGETDELKELLTTYEQLTDQVEEYKQKLQEEVTGIGFGSLVDEITAMFAEGKDSAADFAEFFQKKMEDAIIQSFRRKAIEKQMQQFYDAFALAAEDGVDQEEIATLRADFLKKMAEAQKELDALNQIAGTNIGQNANAEDERQDTLTGAIRNQLTEETGGKIAGIMQGQFGLLKQQLVSLDGIGSNMGDLLAVAQNNLTYAMQTAQNTRLTYEGVNRTETTLTSMDTSLKKLANSTSQSARDMGLGG